MLSGMKVGQAALLQPVDRAGKWPAVRALEADLVHEQSRGVERANGEPFDRP